MQPSKHALGPNKPSQMPFAHRLAPGESGSRANAEPWNVRKIMNEGRPRTPLSPPYLVHPHTLPRGVASPLVPHLS